MDEQLPEVNAEPGEGGIGKFPQIVMAARWLFILMGVVWLAFGVWSIMRIGEVSSNVPIEVLWIVAILMFVNAFLLFWVGWGIARGNSVYYYFGILLLAGNIFLTFTDEFGLFDILTLIIDVILLVLLIAGRSKFLTINHSTKGN
jgi:hypothetical protein